MALIINEKHWLEPIITYLMIGPLKLDFTHYLAPVISSLQLPLNIQF